MEFKDQMNNIIRMDKYPSRIISLVPSQTELLFDLGLDAEVAGITRYCIYPPDKTDKRIKIGGPKKFQFEVIDKLQPDLIIGNKEENYSEGIQQLQEKYPVWMSDIATLEDAFLMIWSVGELVNKGENSRQIINEIKTRMDRLESYPLMKVVYFIWKDPYMVAGGNTFITNMLYKCGLINIFSSTGSYPKVTLDQIDEAEVILLSSEPYPFSQQDIEIFRKKYPNLPVLLVDGTMFSWYGSRLKYAATYYLTLREEIRKCDAV
ncbi:MAG: ABC transporter substrate-binding protein [Bacteroidales bacterium]|nr:ABC transporter substrate-binding protein [Bacteroidales bacterium]